MASDILPSEDLIDKNICNNHRVSVLKLYLFVLVCLLLGTSKFVVSIFFKLRSCKLEVQLICEYGLYVDFYGTSVPAIQLFWFIWVIIILFKSIQTRQ